MSLTKDDLSAIDTIVEKRVKEGNEELALIVNHGFEGVQGQIEAVKSDLGTVKQGVTAITDHIEKIENAFAMPKEERLRVRR